MKSLEERFWAKVTKGDGCWEWNARTKPGKWPYGLLRLRRGKDVRAHRFSYELNVGPIPPGMMVCHKCDNPKCVRPDHLFVGTCKDNMQDCLSKGRHMHQTRPETLLRGDSHPTRKRPEIVRRGTNIKWAKLTEQTVSDMRRSFNDGVSGPALAAKHCIYLGTAYKAIYGFSWKHVPMPDGGIIPKFTPSK